MKTEEMLSFLMARAAFWASRKMDQSHVYILRIGARLETPASGLGVSNSGDEVGIVYARLQNETSVGDSR